MTAAATIEELKLPCLRGSAPGPLHSIVLDPEGNLYYSDELNHLVASLHRGGGPRWHVGGKGSENNCFHYPRGIELGYLRHEGERRYCLAVCDSWNHRVQFLSLEGNLIACWDGRSFGEINDIRYIRCNDGCPQECRCWIVLDKTNHKLHILDEEGNAQFNVGSVLPPNLEGRLQAANTCSDLCRVAESLPSHPSFDFVYYPARILGSSAHSLFVWEPFSRRLKGVLSGNLFPLPFPSAPHAEWISADGSGFVGWDRSDNRLLFFDAAGGLFHEETIEGTPVPSNISSNGVWLQNGASLLRMELSRIPGMQKSESLWKRSLEKAIADEHSAAPDELLHALWSSLAALTDLGEMLALHQDDDALDEILPGEISARMDAMNRELHSSFAKIRERTRLSLQWCSMVETLCLATKSLPKGVEEAADVGKALAEQVSAKICEIRELLDRLVLARTCPPQKDGAAFGFQETPNPFARLKKAPVPYYEAPVWTRRLSRLAGSSLFAAPHSTFARWRMLIAELEENLVQFIRNLSSWIDASLVDPKWAPETRHSLTALEPALVNSAVCPIARPAFRSLPKTSRGIKEAGRISLPPGSVNPPARLYGLAAARNGHLFASLFNANAIAHFDETGKLVEVTDSRAGNRINLQNPAGLSLDAQGRLWIIEHLTGRLRRWDFQTNLFETVEDGGPAPIVLNGPYGIAPDGNGGMLIADTCNHRVVRVPPTGAWQIARPGDKKDIWGMRHPLGFCSDENSGRLWVVDHRNHRILEMAADDGPVAEIGRAGLGRGRLLWPESAVMFRDGAMAVAQGRVLRTLKIFSGMGEELASLTLDFMPGCMAVRDNLLLIAEFDGDGIRIFERE